MLFKKTTQYSKVWDHQTDLSDSLSFYCYFLPSISTIYSRLCLLITTHQWYYHKEYARLWSCRMDWTMIPNPTVSYFLEDPIHRDWHPWCSRSWGVANLTVIGSVEFFGVVPFSSLMARSASNRWSKRIKPTPLERPKIIQKVSTHG